MPKESYQVYVADAFAKEVFCGNQAGVLLLKEGQNFPPESEMCKIAGELKHSETAFVKQTAPDAFRIRYFTPVEEVELCGHATIGAFQVLREEGKIGCGSFRLLTKNRQLQVRVEKDGIWMDMAAPEELAVFGEEEAAALYEAYGLGSPDRPNGMVPKIINTGLSDIMLPVKDRDSLTRAVQDAERVEALSRKYRVVGVHMFALGDRLEREIIAGGPAEETAGAADGMQDDTGHADSITAECRNFAPLYGIPEESATGTSNGALTYYLYGYGLIGNREENTFLQGTVMGKPSYVKSILKKDAVTGEIRIQIGGSAVISLKGELTGVKQNAE